jgi:hypothetical protein
MEACRCTNCGNATLVPGQLIVPEGNQVYGFAPALTRSHVRLRAAFNACTCCGHLAASVSPEELRAAIDRHGRELAKQHLEFSVSGPYRDVPEVAEARKAADCVAEIDALNYCRERIGSGQAIPPADGKNVGRGTHNRLEVARPYTSAEAGPRRLASQGKLRRR